MNAIDFPRCYGAYYFMINIYLAGISSFLSISSRPLSISSLDNPLCFNFCRSKICWTVKRGQFASSISDVVGVDGLIQKSQYRIGYYKGTTILSLRIRSYNIIKIIIMNSHMKTFMDIRHITTISHHQCIKYMHLLITYELYVKFRRVEIISVLKPSITTLVKHFTNKNTKG